MGDKRLEVTRTVTQELTGSLRDLVLFVHSLKDKGRIQTTMTDQEIVEAADSFWDTQHGED